MTEPPTGAGKDISTLGRAARKLLWSLPDPVKSRFSDAYHRWAPRRPPPGETIDFPSDIADPEELRAFLSDTDIFGSAPEEGDNYLSHALERFRITLAVTPAVPDGQPVLELGSNPYFFTRMLERRGMNVTCANWFGPQVDLGSEGSQEVSSPKRGTSRVYRFDHFDIETSRFPYGDESFATVFFCEILEHLPLDPINALAEIHRVLRKPDGVLVLSTPNPVRTENLVKMIGGDNVYEPLSAYGVHGRHNREYTVTELRELLEDLGFEVMRVFTADVSPAPPAIPDSLGGVEVADRGEYVFAVARAVGPDRWRYPPWLYQSRHALARAVLPDLEVGRNDDLQSQGFHDRETMAGREVRWMAKQATVLLGPSIEGPAQLRITGVAPPIGAGFPIKLHADVMGEEVSATIVPGEGLFSVVLPVSADAGEVWVALGADRTWRPVDVGLGADDRELSVAISSVGLEPRKDGDHT